MGRPMICRVPIPEFDTSLAVLDAFCHDTRAMEVYLTEKDHELGGE